jgi:hypothetical protein
VRGQAVLKEQYGALGGEIDPSERYMVVEAAGKIWAVHWQKDAGRRLPATFHGHTLRYKQTYFGWQLPERAPRLAGVCASLDELSDELRVVTPDQNRRASIVVPGKTPW